MSGTFGQGYVRQRFGPEDMSKGFDNLADLKKIAFLNSAQQQMTPIEVQNHDRRVLLKFILKYLRGKLYAT